MISDGYTHCARGRHGASIDLRHLEDVLKQPRQPVQAAQRDVHLTGALLVGQSRRRGDEIADGDLDRRQRRAKVVRQRREQRRLQLDASLRDLDLLALFEQPHRLPMPAAGQRRTADWPRR